MHDVVTVTLIILITALLRWSLLTDPDAGSGVRAEGLEDGFTTPAHAPVKTDSPHPVRHKGTRPQGF